MVYQRFHKDCVAGCKVYVAYIRIGCRWWKIGKYHTICGKFTPKIANQEDLARWYQHVFQREMPKMRYLREIGVVK
jgi:uncharacterized Fe-S cluster-containing MiaB family protein